MRTYKELESLRISLNSDYCTMLKSNLINKEEFSICIKGMSLKIKENYEKSGFKTDYFPKHGVLK